MPEAKKPLAPSGGEIQQSLARFMAMRGNGKAARGKPGK